MTENEDTCSAAYGLQQPLTSVYEKAIFLFFTFCALVAQAQKETFDIATYQPPAGWQKESQAGVVAYSTTNNKTRTWAKILIYKSTASKGTIEQDFQTDWTELVANIYKINEPARSISEKQSGGWDIKSGSGIFKFNGADAAANITTTSGSGRCMSVVFLLNNEVYLNDLENFMSTFTLKVEGSNVLSGKSIPAPKTTTSGGTSPASNTGTGATGKPTTVKAAFTTTNFDNGWTSVAKEEWVEVTKGTMKALIHYPTDKIDKSSMVYKTIGQNAWNTLVAPRYSNLSNFYQLDGNMSFEPGYLLSGDVTENGSGRKVFVVLFMQGRSPWIEFVCPDRNTFIQTFGFDKVDAYFTEWGPLVKIGDYNRFAVAASDLTGKWTTSFTGVQQYYNVYTGASAGATSYSSAQTYEFTGGNGYRWEINVASGRVGNAKFQNVKSSGVFKNVNNWQVHFSDMEGKPKTYDAFFSFIKGGRILWFSDVTYPGYTSFFKAN